VGRVAHSVKRPATGARFDAPVQTGPGAHPASCIICARSFPGEESDRGVTLIPHPLLVPRSKNSKSIPVLSLRAFMGCEKCETYLDNGCGLNCCLVALCISCLKSH
jgi:hypothetical protein